MKWGVLFRGRGGKGTWGCEGRDAVALLPKLIEGASWQVGTLARGTPFRGQGGELVCGGVY